jgi:hypothetical protein
VIDSPRLPVDDVEARLGDALAFLRARSALAPRVGLNQLLWPSVLALQRLEPARLADLQTAPRQRRRSSFAQIVRPGSFTRTGSAG